MDDSFGWSSNPLAAAPAATTPTQTAPDMSAMVNPVVGGITAGAGVAAQIAGLFINYNQTRIAQERQQGVENFKEQTYLNETDFNQKQAKAQIDIAKKELGLKTEAQNIAQSQGNDTTKMNAIATVQNMLNKTPSMAQQLLKNWSA